MHSSIQSVYIEYSSPLCQTQDPETRAMRKVDIVPSSDEACSVAGIGKREVGVTQPSSL